MESKRGRETDPRGTQNTTDFTSDSRLLTETTWVWQDKNDLIKLSVSVVSPQRFIFLLKVGQD